jgi:hypothetical protein
VINAVRDFFNERGFILADTPIFTPAACEGTTTLFPVQYFEDTTAFLTQSGQLYNEANAMALGRVYCFGPTFRAEKSKTRRHLTEFWMVEPEMAYATLDDVMALAEALVVYVVGRTLDRRKQELKTLERDTSKLELVQAPFPRISYDEAAERLKQKGLPFEWGGDFGAPDETALSEDFDRPICVHRLSVRDQGVLHEAGPASPELALGVDVLAPEGYGEIIGGGERLADLDLLLQRIKGTRPAAGGLRVVPRPAPLRHRAARRLRHGHRARRVLDLRPRAPARGHPLPAHAVSDVSVKIGFLSLSPLGCPKNLVDGEVMLGIAREAGHEITPSRRRRRDRREHLRLHRLGQAGVDRRHPRDGRAEEDGRCRGSS